MLIVRRAFPNLGDPVPKETHLPPSRIRYLQKHPTVSFRVTMEERQRLERLRKKTRLSLSIIVRQALGLMEAKVDNAYRQGYNAGYGRFEAPCSKCGKPVKFDIKTQQDVRDELMNAFREWHHNPCPQA